MIELKTNQKVPLEIGGYCTIKTELGKGGQGIVYLVDHNGKDMALKWYTSFQSNAFYHNMQNNIINRQPPLNTLIWSKNLTKSKNWQFGYIMDLRPDGYLAMRHHYR